MNFLDVAAIVSDNGSKRGFTSGNCLMTSTRIEGDKLMGTNGDYRWTGGCGGNFH